MHLFRKVDRKGNEKIIIYRTRLSSSKREMEAMLYKQDVSRKGRCISDTELLWRCLTQNVSQKGSEGTDTVQASVRSHSKKKNCFC
jgi:hypothetical protein